MRVGSLVFATDQGLGILAKSFFDHGIVNDVAVVRHGRRPEHKEWYPSALTVKDVHRDRPLLLDWVKTLDVLFAFETPFDWTLFPTCRERGIKTVLLTMYECTPDPIPAEPDLYLCPSLLDLEYFPPAKSRFLPIPVEVPWRRRERARVFVHNAGHEGLRGRNGTKEVLEAWNLVKSPANLLLRSQDPLGYGLDDQTRVFCPGDGRDGQTLKVETGTISYTTLWKEGGAGDVFLFPEKFNGLSLPLQEARAAGMLVIGTDRFPINTWLPKDPLIPVVRTQRTRVSPRCVPLDEAIVSPQDIAAKIDEWYDKDISTYSEEGREWASTMSWDVLGPQYLAVLRSIP